MSTKKLSIHKFLQRVGFPEEVAQQFDGNFDNEAIRKFKQYVGSDYVNKLKDTWFVFYGPVGTGKTYAAAAAAYLYYYADLIHSPTEAIFVPAYHFNNMDDETVYQLSVQRSLIIIDDLATESRAAKELIENLVFYMYNTQKYLIITTNFAEKVTSPDRLQMEYKSIYDARMVSRLFSKAVFIRSSKVVRKSKNIVL